MQPLYNTQWHAQLILMHIRKYLLPKNRFGLWHNIYVVITN